MVVNAPGAHRSSPRWQLFPRHPELDHHALLPFVTDHGMAMEEKAAVFFQVGARDGLAPGMLCIEGRGP